MVTMKGAPAIQGYRNVGSQLIVNYVASHQWSITAKNWQIVKDSSFNTDGSRPEFDCAKPNGGLDKSLVRMQPQPGRAAAWTWGYYPAGVKGVGLPRMLFVLSVKRVWNMAWYMLNQVTLDKGPDILYPNNECAYGNNNCWAAGNAGEIDFLESVWTVNAGTTDSYQRIKLVGLLLVRWDRHVTVTEAGLMNRLQAITTSLEHTPTNLSRTYMQLL